MDDALALMKNKICEICGEKFFSKWGTRRTCSNTCLKKLKSTDEYKAKLVAKQKASFIKKYGVDNPAKCDEVKKKTELTCIKRYGAKSPTLNDAVRKKQNKTCQIKYGVDTPLENKEIFDKTKKTLLKNFGVETTWESELIQSSSIQTKIERYGDKNYNNPKKASDTSLAHYGVENPSQSSEIKSKIKNTCKDRYGVEYPLQSNVIRKKSILTNIERYGVDNPAKCEEVKNKTIATNVKKYGSKYPIESEKIKKKAKDKLLGNHYRNVILRKFSHLVEPLFTEDEYSGNISYSKKYPFKCIKCNSVFEDTLCSSHIPRCQKCNPIKAGTSNMEKEILDFIKSIFPHDTILNGDKKILVGKELDIYVPSKKLAVELDGLYWHSEIGGKKSVNYHISKTKECEKNGIQLIHIFEDEWVNKQQIVKDKLRHLSNTDTEKIYGRKCKIQEISSSECSAFLNRYHLQGSDKSCVKIGAFYKDELVAVMTFGSNRIALGNTKYSDEYELYRFCVNKTVVGVAGKLISYFIKKYSPKKITTYSDRRYTSIQSNFYSKVGFKFISETKPCYWYTKDYINREYRFNYRKDQLSKKLEKFDPNLTEWENMKNNGFDRIWDCGNLKYEMIINEKTTK